MVLSNRPFARKFKKNDPVLSKIDRELLKRRRGQFTNGGWCSGNERRNRLCPSLQSNYGVLKPGPGSRRLKTLLTRLLFPKNFQKQQCRWFFSPFFNLKYWICCVQQRAFPIFSNLEVIHAYIKIYIYTHIHIYRDSIEGFWCNILKSGRTIVAIVFILSNKII